MTVICLGCDLVSVVRVTESTYTFSEDVELLALYPESTPDEPFRIDAVRPGGRVEAILVIEEFNAEWREKYLLAEPLRLPSGTELRLTHGAVWIDFMVSSAATAE